MSKRKKMDPKITKHTIPGGGYVFEVRQGEPDHSTLIKFLNDEEKHDFSNAIKYCVEQTESFNGLSPLVTRAISDPQDGAYKLEFFSIKPAGMKNTILDLPDIISEKDFIETAINHSNSIGDPENHIMGDIMIAVSAKLFELNQGHTEMKYYGKMMYLFSILCSYSSHVNFLRQEGQNRRKILLNKINTVEDVFKYGLVTESIWSSAPFWGSLKSSLMLEYDSIPDDTLLAPFTEEFLHLKVITKEFKATETSTYNSILRILDDFEVFKKFYGNGEKLLRADKRRKISDRFKNLPKYDSSPGVEIFF